MPLVTAGLTALTLAGSPGLAPFEFEVSSNVPRPTLSPFTELSLGAGPGRISGPFVKEVPNVLPLAVVDTANLSGTESPVDANQITTWDTARLASTEVVGLVIRYAVTDIATLSVSEQIGLTQSGVLDRPVTDTASLSSSEVVALAVQVALTDTASMSASETATVVNTGVSIGVTDTASLQSVDTESVTIFTGSLSFTVGDSAFLTASEVAFVTTPAQVSAIRIKATVPRIAFRKL
jgi:hypothetical protein